MRNQRGSDPRAVVTSWSRGIIGNMREAGDREDRSGNSSVLRVVAGDIGLIVVVVSAVVVVVAVVVGTNPRGPRDALRRVTSRN